jgi:DNA-3-methyladenine glycosylase
VRPGQAALSHAGLRQRFATPLLARFYDRPTPVVARALLGRWLVVRSGRSYRAARIVETEAYVADDPANHADRGPTRRNAAMFGPPGTLYVYPIHQVHCANAVTRPGQAVLLRAAEPVSPGLASLSGPGRLCRSLGISGEDDRSSLLRDRVRIVVGDATPHSVVRTTRVGISRAVERPLRFLWAGHPAVSSPRPWARRRA